MVQKRKIKRLIRNFPPTILKTAQRLRFVCVKAIRTTLRKPTVKKWLKQKDYLVKQVPVFSRQLFTVLQQKTQSFVRTYIPKQFFNPKSLRVGVASLLLGVLVIQLFLPSTQNTALAGTATFVQSSWAGGASSTAIAADPTNRTGWNYFSTSTNLDFATSATGPRLNSSTYSATDDTTFSSTGAATGGGFATGVFTNTSHDSSGENISLSTSSQSTLNRFDMQFPNFWNSAANEIDLLATSTYVYALYADSSLTHHELYRFDITDNTWSAFADMPSGATYGSDIAIDETYIYVLDGGGTSVYRHTLADTSSAWVTFATFTSAAYDGADMEVYGGYIYVLPANNSANLFRHSTAVTTGSWDTFTIPTTVQSEGDVEITEDYVYVLPSNNGTGFYRHTTANTSSAWDSFAALPGTVESGAEMALDANYVYILRGDASTGFHRHTLSDTSTAWETYTVLPSTAGNGSSLEIDGTYAYVMRGGSAPAFYRHDLASTSSAWTTYGGYGAIANGLGDMALNTTDIYVLAKNGVNQSKFLRHTLSNTSSAWEGSSVPNFKSLSVEVDLGAGIEVDDEYMYVATGNSTAFFYRHSLYNTSTDWEQFTSMPSTFSFYGTDIEIDETNNHIYVLRGASGSTAVYRHSATSTSGAWESFTALPEAIGVGSKMHVEGSYVYVVPGNNSPTMYRHVVSSTSGSWESYASITATISTAGRAAMIYDGYAYATFNATTTVYRHELAVTSTSWQAYAALPGATNNGAYLLVDDNYIYAQRGSNTAMYRHAVATTSGSWDSFVAMPVSPSTLSSLVMDDTYIYAITSGGLGLYRHTLSDTSSAWGALHPSYGYFNNGLSAVMSQDKNKIFMLDGVADGVTLGYVFPFVINDVTYNTSGNFVSDAIELGASSLVSISWTSSTPSVVGTDALRLQIATSSDDVSYSSYVGSDGTSGTYFSSGSATLTNSLTIGAKYFKYKAYLESDTTAATPSLNSFTINYRAYSTTGTLVSSIYNTGDPANRVASMRWTGTTSSVATLQFQIRTASSSAGVTSATWSGPDGTNSTYFTSAAGGDAVTSTYADGSNDQYVQYQAFFATDGITTPILNSATLTYVVNQAPQVQNVTATQNSDGTVSIAYEIRSPDTTEDTGSVGVLTPSFKYCAGGTSCSSITALLSGATSTKSVNVDGVTWTSLTTTWTPTTDYSNIFDADAKVMITANDLQAANNLGHATSSAFTLDTKVPSGTSILVDASSTLAVVTVTAIDTSTPVVMRIATSTNALAVASYGTFATTTALALGVDPATIYVQFKDAYNNTTTAISVTTPETPDYMIIQDNSNVTPPDALDYRLFIAWKAVALPPQGSFGAYKVYRSENQTTWTLLATITDRTTNFYTDTTAPSNTLEYYKVISTDSLGNVSFSSAIVNGMADGIQDYGEGGGGTAPPPVITNIATSTISPSSFTVTWDTDTLSNSRVSYSAMAGVFTSNVTVASYVSTAATVGRHQVIVAGLTPDTTYYFKVVSTDSGNNAAEEDNGGDGFIVRTSPGPTITALPTVTNVANTSALVSWETSLDANSIVYYSTSSDFIASSTASNLGTFATTHDITLSNLTANTRYYYYVASTDQSGYTVTDRNIVSGVAQYYSFSTTNDSDAPTFSAFDATVNTSSAFVIWTTNKLANSQVDYGLTTSYGSSTVLDATQTVQHYVPLTGLTANTLYHYRARSTDNNGNAGVSSDQTFTTNQLDTIPPVISNVATSSIALTLATITWTTDKQTNKTVEYGTTEAYGSIAGNLYDFTTTTHSVTLTGLTGNTTYYFRANSTDQSGNNATSSQYTFTTAADVTPPVISSVVQVIDQTSGLISWNTDELAIGQVDYGLTSTTLDTTVAVTSSFRLTHAMVLAGLTPNTTYYFQVTSADPSANTTTQAVSTFTTVAFGQTTRTIVSGGSTNAFGDTASALGPVVSNVVVKNQDPFSVLITWNTDKEGNSFVKYGKTTKYGTFAGDEIARLLSHSVSLFNLDPATTYHFKALTIDTTGKLGMSDDMIFTTLNTAGEIVTSTPEIDKPSEDTASSSDDYLLTKIKTASVQLLEKMLRSFTINPAIKEIPEDSIVATIADITQRVVGAPTIVGLRPEVQVRGNSAIIGWYTDKKTDGIVSYAKHSDYQPASDKPYTLSAADTSPISTVHIVDLANLEPATQYHFQVISKGEIGSETRSADFVFTTESVLPVIENVKIVEVKSNSVDLEWKTNIPTLSTIVYTNLSTKKTSTVGDQTYLVNHTFTVPNLEPGTRYSVVVKGENEAKDIISSSPITFTTTIDNDSPVITNLSANSTLYPGKNSKVQTIVTWKTDEPATSQVFFQEGVQNGGKVVSTTFDAAFDVDHIMVLTNFKPGTVYKYWAESLDSSGNKTQSAIYTMLTPIQKETIIDIIGKNFQSVFGWTNQVKL